MRILLLGYTGQVGWELARTLSTLGEVITTARDDSADLKLDAADLDQVHAALDRIAPDVIVNAVAYTAVDQAEGEPQQAMRLNGEMPGVIGDWAAGHDALVVHYSTDYVFDGEKPTAYVETDPTCPISVYGESKLAGDRALLASGCAVIILRVSWVYGVRGKNFLLTMQRLMREQDRLSVVDDQRGTPTWCRTIAQATATVLARLPADRQQRMALRGVYHLAPAGETSWFGFAQAIRDIAGLDCELHPIPSSAYPTAARRPANSRMDAHKLAERFGVALPDWRRELGYCLQDTKTTR